MQTLLVLGIIPGTNIQISFQVWLAMLLIVICWPMIRRHQAQIKQVPAVARLQVHASSLHSRLMQISRPTA